EDWKYRMVTPNKGVFDSLTLNAEGRRVGNMWDPAKDEAAGEQCKAYGAPNVMRLPGRVHITWQDANTLKVETDAGTQTRLFRFNGTGGAGTQPVRRTLQGNSVAAWESGAAGGGGGGFATFAAGPGGGPGVLTRQSRAGCF